MTESFLTALPADTIPVAGGACERIATLGVRDPFQHQLVLVFYMAQLLLLGLLPTGVPGVSQPFIMRVIQVPLTIPHSLFPDIPDPVHEFLVLLCDLLLSYGLGHLSFGLVEGVLFVVFL